MVFPLTFISNLSITEFLMTGALTPKFLEASIVSPLKSGLVNVM